MVNKGLLSSLNKFLRATPYQLQFKNIKELVDYLKSFEVQYE